MIVGDPGSGKTTFLRRIASTLSRDLKERPGSSFKTQPQWRSAFPVFILVAELGEHIRRCRCRVGGDGPFKPGSPAWLPDFLGKRNSEYNWGLDEAFFRSKLETGSCILLLDGLDEAPGRPERESTIELFENATRAYLRCRFVVTTRPLALAGHAVPGFREARIEPLEPEAIDRFLEGPRRPASHQSGEQTKRDLARRTPLRRESS